MQTRAQAEQYAQREDRFDGWDSIVRHDPLKLAHLTDAQLAELVHETHRWNVERARESSAAFCEYVLTHEADGRSISNADFHREWHQTCADNQFVALLSPVEHGKTQHLAIGYLLWKLGKNPNLRCALICDTAPQAKDRLEAVVKHIRENPRVQEVFPGLRVVRWSRGDGELVIARAEGVIAKEVSVFACGSGGPINGKRLDLIILDDVLDFENTWTPEGRAKIIHWFDTTVMTRSTEGGQIIAIGTPWAQDDLMANLQKRKGWAARTYSAVENPDDPYPQWRLLWPGGWSLSRMWERFTNTPLLTFFRKYLCRVLSDATSRFRSAWFALCKQLGRGRYLTPRRPVRYPSMIPLPCFTGVDLGNSPRKRKTQGADVGQGLTTLVTFAVDERGRRIILEVQAGRWKGPEILDRIQDVYTRYQSTIAVESNGVQEFLVQFAQMRSIPCVAFQTDGKKHDETYGLESIGVEMRAGLWVWPSGEDGQMQGEHFAELAALEAEMIAFQPGSHTGDRFMALWFARVIATEVIVEVMREINTIAR